jgi:hypothetical protein
LNGLDEAGGLDRYSYIKQRSEIDSDLEEEEEKAARIEDYKSSKNYLEEGDWISYFDPIFNDKLKIAQITGNDYIFISIFF